MSEKKVVLYAGTDFTTTKLVEYLNKKYKEKKSGIIFNLQDVEGYERREKIPDEYGGQKIQIIKVREIGIKILRLLKKK